MRASRFPAVTGLAGVVIATSMLVAPASFAQGRHDRAFFGDAYARSYAGHVAHGYQAYPGSIPQDYSSSYLCINGYRWITQELDHRESPAENVTPVRCR